MKGIIKSTDSSAQQNMDFPTVMEKLGGLEGIHYFVIDLYDRTLESKDLRHFFVDIDMVSLRRHQEDYLVSALSNTQYEGPSLFKSHIHLIKNKGLEAKHIHKFTAIMNDCLQERTDDPEVIEFVNDFINSCADEILDLGENSSQQAPNFSIILKKLGGFKGVRALVDDFCDKTNESEELMHFFSDEDMAFFRKHQEDFLVSALSETHYDVMNLIEAHSDLIANKGLEAKHIGMMATILHDCLTERGCDAEVIVLMENFLKSSTAALINPES